jgi:hypothetical protein
VEKKQLAHLLFGISLILALVLSACSPVATTPSTPATPVAPATPATPTAPAAPAVVSLKSITSSPSGTEIRFNNTKQLDITAIYTDGTTRIVTDKSTFKSSDDKIATVTAGGLVTGLVPGSTSIIISYTENQVTQTVTVPVTVKLSFLGPE